MKKLLAILLVCLPVAAFGQVKPGIPISEVVRQAKEQAAAEKNQKSQAPQPFRILPTTGQAAPESAAHTTPAQSMPRPASQSVSGSYGNGIIYQLPSLRTATRSADGTTYQTLPPYQNKPQVVRESKIRTPRAPRVQRAPRTTQNTTMQPATTNNASQPYTAATVTPASTSRITAPRAQRTPVVREPRLTTPRTPRVKQQSAWPAYSDQLDFSRQFGLSLSTNSLMWLTAMPNLDLRLQYDKFSLIGSVSYSNWNLPDQKFWWNTSFGGELRYDITPNVYIGATYNWFNYNFKLSSTGNQGTAQSLGIVAGYKLPIGRTLSLDFGLGLGYALIDNERYHEEGSALVRDERRTFGYWGPIKAQVSLVWRIL